MFAINYIPNPVKQNETIPSVPRLIESESLKTPQGLNVKPNVSATPIAATMGECKQRKKKKTTYSRK
jgi:hypothetical protein